MATKTYCRNCEQEVKAAKGFSWSVFLLCFIFGIGLGGFLYILYWLIFKRKTCAVCGGRNFGSPPAESHNHNEQRQPEPPARQPDPPANQPVETEDRDGGNPTETTQTKKRSEDTRNAEPIICPKCDHENPNVAEYCLMCGEHIVSRECPNCGDGLRPQHQYCPMCGTPINGDGQDGMTQRSRGDGQTGAPNDSSEKLAEDESEKRGDESPPDEGTGAEPESPETVENGSNDENVGTTEESKKEPTAPQSMGTESNNEPIGGGSGTKETADEHPPAKVSAGSNRPDREGRTNGAAGTAEARAQNSSTSTVDPSTLDTDFRVSYYTTESKLFVKYLGDDELPPKNLEIYGSFETLNWEDLSTRPGPVRDGHRISISEDVPGVRNLSDPWISVKYDGGDDAPVTLFEWSQ